MSRTAREGIARRAVPRTQLPPRRVAIAVAMISAALVMLFAPSGAAACSAATEASPGRLSYLPNCEADELVTPPLGAYFRLPPLISPDGNHVFGTAFAALAGTENNENNGLEFGAMYEFTRTPSGWSTEAIEPPPSQFPRRHFVAASPGLDRTLWELAMPAQGNEEVGISDPASYVLAVREKDAGGSAHIALVGPVAGPAHDVPAGGPRLSGFSGDLTHVELEQRNVEGQLWPGDSTSEPGALSLYQYAGVGKSEPELVGVSNEGALSGVHSVNEHAELISRCGTVLGSAEKGTTLGAVSSDGATVSFTALHGECSTPKVDELYARLDAVHTVDVSEPAVTAQRAQECTGLCLESEREENGHGRSPGLFEGASADGRLVFFSTTQPLLDGDAAGTADIYEAELAGGAVRRLVRVTKPQSVGEDAAAVAVLRVAPGGQRVYYVARGKLLNAPNEYGEVAARGGYNLYVYDTATGANTFVTSLLDAGEVGAIEAGVRGEAEGAITLEEAECKRFEEEGQPELQALCETQVASLRASLEGTVSKKIQKEVLRLTSVSQHDRRRPYQVTSDGRYFLFSSARQITGSEDSSTVAQLFEYDAALNSIVRVSKGHSGSFPCALTKRVEQGYNCNGNTTAADTQATMVSSPEGYEEQTVPAAPSSLLSLAADGAVAFASPVALAPGAADKRPVPQLVEQPPYAENIYEYRGGDVNLISAPDEAVRIGTASSRLLGIDEAGDSVFFASSLSLVPSDTDLQLSWYVARSEGGFPAPLETAGCQGEACHGALLSPPGTIPTNGGGPGEASLSPAGKAPSAGSRLTRAERLARALAKCRHRHSRRERASCRRAARRRFASASGAHRRSRRK
jgi:hypothetical protein